MNLGKLVFAQITQHLPLTMFRRRVARDGGEHKVKTLSPAFRSTPPLVDLPRASHLDPFEQPARGFFQYPASPGSRAPESFLLCRHAGANRHPEFLRSREKMGVRKPLFL
jgi:hypothetical protein